MAAKTHDAQVTLYWDPKTKVWTITARRHKGFAAVRAQTTVSLGTPGDLKKLAEAVKRELESWLPY